MNESFVAGLQKMGVLSVNVGLPRLITWKGQTVKTGIFKRPVSGGRELRLHQLSGDGQADLAEHGGRDKALYVYTIEHYNFWREFLGREDFRPGQFGENLTVRGMPEEKICVGDVFRVGTAVVEVSQPRVPCRKLDIRMDQAGFLRVFLSSLRTGFYLRVLQEGTVAAGDVIEKLRGDPAPVSVREVTRVYFNRGDWRGAQVVVQNRALSEGWRRKLLKRLENETSGK